MIQKSFAYSIVAAATLVTFALLRESQVPAATSAVAHDAKCDKTESEADEVRKNVLVGQCGTPRSAKKSLDSFEITARV